MDVLSVHMDNCPLYKALLTVEEKKATGRMTIEEHNGQNHMYFMQGMPVGVQTSKYLAPLGQLLLERNLCDATTFISAQRRIRDGGGLLPGQVFMGMGVINEDQLKEILAIQSTRKAHHFCKLGSRSFTFSKGLTFLTGFQPTPMHMHMLVFLAVSQQLTKKVRERFLELLSGKEVRLKDCGDDLLPAPLEVYGFGPAEKRFLTRLNQQYQPIWECSRAGLCCETARPPCCVICRWKAFWKCAKANRVLSPSPMARPHSTLKKYKPSNLKINYRPRPSPKGQKRHREENPPFRAFALRRASIGGLYAWTASAPGRSVAIGDNFTPNSVRSNGFVPQIAV